MKASELRIGNFVGNKGRVTMTNLNYFTIEENHSVVSSAERDIKPILLNREWLLKFGFKDDRILLPGDGEIEIRLKGGTFHIWPSDGQTESHNYRNLIQYVHQLQNLYFALTGEELTIGALHNGNN